MKSLAFVLMLMSVILVGCEAKPQEPDHSVLTSTPVESPVDPQPTPLSPPSLTEVADAITSLNMASQLVPYESGLFGVSFSYPGNLNKPEVTQVGFPRLRLDLGNGEFFVYRDQAKPDKSLADLITEGIEANTKASNGRIVSKTLGQQILGGEEAWGVQRYFDSSAGRYDTVSYIVRTGEFDYTVGCQTQQGPPVVPWGAVAPVCSRILGTIGFGHSTSDQPNPQIPNLAGTTALVAGAGQTETVTLTDSTVIRQLVEVLSAPLSGQSQSGRTLCYVNFMSGNQTLGQLWVRTDFPIRTPTAIRFDGDTAWHTAPPAVAELLQPLLQQIPGMKVP